MTKDEIIAMAVKSELVFTNEEGEAFPAWLDHVDLTPYLVKFAQEVLSYARAKEFQGLFDPKYDAVFTADAAREAFKHVEVKENKE